MIKTLSILIFSLLAGCHQKGFQEKINDVKDEFSNQADSQNEKLLSWEETINNITVLADSNQRLAINHIDSLIQFDTTLNTEKISDLHFIKGDIYYNNDNFEKAIVEFSLAAQSLQFESPKILAAKAGAYIKLKRFDTALNELNHAAEIN